MSDERPRYGPLVSGLGAAVLGISVFLPWYSVTLTQAGVESAQHTLGAVAQQFGNQSFQSDRRRSRRQIRGARRPPAGNAQRP